VPREQIIDAKSRGGACPSRTRSPDGELEIQLRGDLASILALSKTGENKAFSTKEKALQIKMVAGAGFEPATFRL